MANTIYCMAHNNEHPADVLITQLDGSGSMALCGPAFMEFAMTMVEASVAAEVAATDEEAIAQLERAEGKRKRGRGSRESSAEAVPAESSKPDDQTVELLADPDEIVDLRTMEPV